jgi:hypothetical protein
MHARSRFYTEKTAVAEEQGGCLEQIHAGQSVIVVVATLQPTIGDDIRIRHIE